MFTPSLPVGGLLGWRLLQNTEAAQREAFDASAQVQRLTEYFSENIAAADTAEKLVADRQLLEVALGAFGLSEDLNKQAFIRQVLESDPLDTQSFANRLQSPVYRDLMNAFDYGSVLGTSVGQSDFAQRITAAYRENAFEVAVGDVDQDMRLALNFRDTVGDYAAAVELGSSDEIQWLTILGDTPLRTVLEKALNLPAEIGAIDVDLQVEQFRDRAQAVLGGDGLADLATPEGVDTLIRRYLLAVEVEAGPTLSAPGFAALSLLQSSSLGAGGLLASNF